MLNASYEPLLIVSWQKAILLWFQNKVEVVEHHNEFVRSVSEEFQIPSIIRLKVYVRVQKISRIRFSRENIYIRDKFACQYCQIRFPVRELTLDHVVPVSKGGRQGWNNVVTACKDCNQRKADRTPNEAGMPLVREPYSPDWMPIVGYSFHFEAIPESWKVYLLLPGGSYLASS